MRIYASHLRVELVNSGVLGVNSGVLGDDNDLCYHFVAYVHEKFQIIGARVARVTAPVCGHSYTMCGRSLWWFPCQILYGNNTSLNITGSSIATGNQCRHLSEYSLPDLLPFV